MAKTQTKRNEEASARTDGKVCTQEARRNEHYANMNAYARTKSVQRSVKRVIGGK